MVKVIAEAGCNHMGRMDIAYQLIDAAILCKADIIKFQKRNPKELLTKEEYNAPHPVPANSYGKTYGEHREFLELTKEQHAELKKYCEEHGIIYSTSVWDMTSAKEITELNPSLIKIPSAENTNFKMLKWLCKNYKGEIHLSFGMTTHDEEKAIIEFFKTEGRNKDLVIYSCTSGYPVSFDDICLLEITRLKKEYGNIVKDIGFSGHHLGIAVDIAAITLGANYIERHFTLDRTFKGTDHAASLEPAGMFKLCRDIRNVSKALKYKKTELLAVEEVQRKKLKYKGN
ncbi:N-acetylneuraminate synthase family protein [Succinatimonas hippei]|uniref:N-acetylneuraminate synthase family protein n=1 Tax=Succinatimonas hippei TaxID=626938 RepID=UPI0025A470AF|nr:N-acetylneuraminate synthase family protein [Succinatimonas hippei]MDM8119943.1 N-acetylneuraminate synthase family protein [Succinatimonas hippei]